MNATEFVDREGFWSCLARLKSPGNRVLGAVAYFGKGGAKLLPLLKGDTLLVDLSLSAVRQGVSDPREIKKLIDKGVKVYTRSSLHAKVFVVGKSVIVGSANISANARHYLDEAAIVTSVPSVVKAATTFIRSLCSEPVLPRYLEKCIAEYRPPRFKAARTQRQRRPSRRRAKLWFLSGLQFIDPRQDRDLLDRFEQEDSVHLNGTSSEVNWIRFGYKPRFFSDIVANNWIIDCTRTGRGRRVIGAPARVIRKRTYLSKSGKQYYLLMLERRSTEEETSLARFRQAVKSLVPELNNPRPRTQPLSDGNRSDKVLRLWSTGGKFRARVK
jgi:hypothetical protein